jgi:hypothetical protein
MVIDWKREPMICVPHCATDNLISTYVMLDGAGP